MNRAELEELQKELKKHEIVLCVWDGTRGYGPPYWYPARLEQLSERLRRVRLW